MAQGPRVRSSSSTGDLTARTHGIANRAQYAVWVWREIPVPVIAAVHGVAFGGGFQLALGPTCGSLPRRQAGVLEIKWGLIPDMAGNPAHAPPGAEDIVRELTYTGRVFSGERP